jgi:hypothetical protein
MEVEMNAMKRVPRAREHRTMHGMSIPQIQIQNLYLLQENLTGEQSPEM